MLVATFGPSTGWAGKTITREGEVFTLEDHGPISAADVMEYDRQGQLVWANDGTRAWVGARARTREQQRALTPAAQAVYDLHNGPTPIDFVIGGRSGQCLVAAQDRCVIVKPLPRFAKSRFTEFHPEGSSWAAEKGEFTEFPYKDIAEILVYEWVPVAAPTLGLVRVQEAGRSAGPVLELVTPAYPAKHGGPQGPDPTGRPNCLLLSDSTLHDGAGPARVDQLFRRAGLANDAQSTGIGQSPFLAGISPRRGELSALSIIGLLLVIGGLIAAAYYLMFFDTSVYVPGGYGIDRVNNLGLMADRQNGIIAGIGVALLGGILMLIGFLHPLGRAGPAGASEMPDHSAVGRTGSACGACGKPVDVGVTFCPCCGTKLAWTSGVARGKGSDEGDEDARST